MKSLSLYFAALTVTLSAHAQQVWVEAESFANQGGWVLETQFIDIMGSPYLMAHGMGTVPHHATKRCVRECPETPRMSLAFVARRLLASGLLLAVAAAQADD
ncbi:MAG: hypothetical protein ABL974_22830, partial [Prosthecobacter sp.]